MFYAWFDHSYDSFEYPLLTFMIVLILTFFERLLPITKLNCNVVDGLLSVCGITECNFRLLSLFSCIMTLSSQNNLKVIQKAIADKILFF